MTNHAYICDAIRTPFGRYGGALAPVRADDLGAIQLKALKQRNTDVDWSRLDDVLLGCANQASEDTRNAASLASLLAGLPIEVGGATNPRSEARTVGTACVRKCRNQRSTYPR